MLTLVLVFVEGHWLHLLAVEGWMLWVMGHHRVLHQGHLLTVVAGTGLAWGTALFFHYHFEHFELVLLKLAHGCHLLLVHTLRLVHHALVVMGFPCDLLRLSLRLWHHGHGRDRLGHW